MRRMRIKLKNGINLLLPEVDEIVLINKKMTVKSPIDDEFVNGLKFMSKMRAKKLKEIKL